MYRLYKLGFSIQYRIPGYIYFLHTPWSCAKKLKFVGQLHINIKTFMHKQAINHKQAIIGGGYLFPENACYCQISSLFCFSLSVIKYILFFTVRYQIHFIFHCQIVSLSDIKYIYFSLSDIKYFFSLSDIKYILFFTVKFKNVSWLYCFKVYSPSNNVLVRTFQGPIKIQ